MEYRINGAVGTKCRNDKSDVKLVQALINAYSRQKGLHGIKVTGKVDDSLIDYLLKYQKQHLKIIKAKEIVNPDGKIMKSLNEIFKGVFIPLATSVPKFGTLTWNAEGNGGGACFIAGNFIFQQTHQG
ncbi:hypothetical protein ACQKP8_26650 [Photobacterium alginatilyticum]|uniref:hypothetical protein n=1 Tax=Photobacterium alginatilyticum TaxID=1775171 RepID=UPI0040681EF7